MDQRIDQMSIFVFSRSGRNGEYQRSSIHILRAEHTEFAFQFGSVVTITNDIEIMAVVFAQELLGALKIDGFL